MKEVTIGVLGGGQLGRMLSMEARRMGYRVVQWTGGERSGAETMASEVIYEEFSDPDACDAFLSLVDVVTVEFENIPYALVEKISGVKPTFPDAQAVAICQDRELEKNFLRDSGIPTTPFKVVESAQQLSAALAEIPGDVILKTARGGYDGKGQVTLSEAQRPSSDEVWREFTGERVIVEKKVDLAAEISVMVVRGQCGEVVCYDPAENEHKNHILHLSIVPARLPEDVQTRAMELAVKAVENLNFVGVIGVEFFIDHQGAILVNEMAPRPHNSGHHTLDACATSQFEQQLRAVIGLPLGSAELLRPVVMWNLLGDLWKTPSQQPNWDPILQTKGATLHLYGKQEARKKRKMGHVTFLGASTDDALKNALSCVNYYA